MLRKAYLVLAAVGLIATWTQNIRHFTRDHDAGIFDYMEDAVANPAAASLAGDLMVVAAAAIVFMVVEGRRVHVPHLWLYLVLSPTVAIAVAFPLFLAAREDAIAEVALPRARE